MSIMENMKSLVNFLGEALGELYEISLFDLRDENPALSYITTPSLTGRVIGSPPSDVVANAINDGSWRKKKYIIHTSSCDNFLSSSYFISEGDKLVGILSIVFSQQRLIDVSTSFLKLFNLQISPFEQHVTPEILWRNPADVAHHAICNILQTNDISSELTQFEKQDIVSKLKANGVFRLKGAVSAVASLLSCSEPTIYRYLSNHSAENASTTPTAL